MRGCDRVARPHFFFGVCIRNCDSRPRSFKRKSRLALLLSASVAEWLFCDTHERRHPMGIIALFGLAACAAGYRRNGGSLLVFALIVAAAAGLVSGCASKKVATHSRTVWERGTGTEEVVWFAGTGGGFQLAFEPDGRLKEVRELR